MYARNCNECKKIMLTLENTWKCNDCQPNPVRGKCGRCKRNILYGEDYAHDAPIQEACFNYICKECWEANPQYKIFVFIPEFGWHYIFVPPERYIETKNHYQKILANTSTEIINARLELLKQNKDIE